jgi:small subunit ribosomal protein S6
MARTAPTYDLMLLLDPAADDARREKILADTRALVAKSGEVVGEHDWGQRQMAYEIRHKGEAQYHLLQFHATRELLADLERTLRIADGVTRFRIIKLAPGTPPPPEPRPERAAAEADAEAAA